MPRFLLRLEAVNFDASCYDTNDISTIRGGSMMSSHAHMLVNGALPSELRHSPVSHGASHAIWTFDATDDATAEAVRVKTLQALAAHALLKHGTFVVSVVPDTGVVEDALQLRTINRWSQLHQPTVAVPDAVQNEFSKTHSPYCELDRVRPAVEIREKGDEQKRRSASVIARRKHGIEQKPSFYRRVAGQDFHVVQDTHQLTDHPEGVSHRLNDKMAVIYIDGNQQSEMAARLNSVELGAFREYVRTKHEEFLKQLMRHIEAAKPTQNTSGHWHFWNKEKRQHQVQIETLLWGGDDILLLVPAWQGWWTVQQFYKAAQDWTFHNKPFDNKPFTHATGLVFCQVKAPIQMMRELAASLFVQAKKELKDGKYQDRIGYEVLESFDALPDLDPFHRSRLGSDYLSEFDPLLLNPTQLEQLKQLVVAVKTAVEDPDVKVSRRQIERYSRAMSNKPVGDAFDAEVSAYMSAVPEFTNLDSLSTRQKLFHLTALWDYIG